MTTVRRSELERLVTAAEQVREHGPASLVVAGEAGIGKTTLLRAVSGELERRGWQICRLEADEVRRRIPYGAVAAGCRALAGRLQNSYSERLRRDAVVALDVLAADRRDDRWFGRAEEAMTRLLTALATTGPVLLSLDNANHLDNDSAALLTALHHRLATCPIATFSIVRQSGRGVSSLVRQSGPEPVVVELGPLGAGDLAAVVAPLLGTPPDGRLAAALAEWADGNPLFAIELARSSAAPQTTAPEALLARVLPSGRDVQTVAQAAAVLGRIRLDRLELLARLTRLPEATVAAVFDGLVDAEVLRAAGPTFAFRHRLIEAALYDGLGPACRRQLHGLVATELRADGRRGRPVEPQDLARHVAGSALPGDPDAVAVLAQAAEQTRTATPEKAVAFTERALELAGPDDPERPGLYATRCRALVRLGRPAEAVEAGRVALAGLSAGDTRCRTMTAVLGSLYSGGRTTEALAVIDAEPRPGAVLRSHRAMLLTFTGATAEGAAEARRAEHELAGSTQADQVVACGQLAMAATMLADHERTIRFADRAVEAAGASRSLRRQALAIGACTTSLAGLVDDAASRLALAAADGDRGFESELLTATIVLDWLGGRWDEALRGIARARALLDPAQQVLLTGAVQAVELDIRTWRGELDLAAALAGEPFAAPPNIANLFTLSLANYRAERDGSAEALEVIRTALGDPASAAYGCVLLARRTELALDLGRPADPGELDRLVPGRTSPWSRSALHRAAGLARRHRGTLRQAIDDADGLMFEQARSRLALGLLDGSAVDQLHAAYKAFQVLGAHGLRRTTGARLRELGAKVPRASGRQRGLLTESEERIARLVQQGMRNREIAAALHYSPRSVEVYLSRVYAKLGISSRLELARTLDANQLTAIGSSRL